MIEKLKQLLNNSYSPYSNFPVASIVISKDGQEFFGVNIEDASYRAGTCAERSAIYSAISSGVKKGEFKEIHVMTSSKRVGTPCFVCRQMFTELFDKDVVIHCYSTTGEHKQYTVEQLCPYPFSEDDLKWKVDL